MNRKLDELSNDVNNLEETIRTLNKKAKYLTNLTLKRNSNDDNNFPKFSK